MHTQGANVFQAKGPVVFQQKVEYVPQEMEFDNREADWKMIGAPKEIEVKFDSEDDLSKVSGRNKARKQMAIVQHKDQQEELKHGMGVLSSNYYKVLQQDDGKENAEEEQEEDAEESEKVSSSFDPTYSDVNSREYTTGKDEGSLYKDNEAFFERLAEMTKVMDVELMNIEGPDVSILDDKREGEVSELCCLD
jgi:hypothetical protein